MGMPSIPTLYAKTQLESRAESTGMQDSDTVPAINNVYSYNIIIALYTSRSVGVPSNVLWLTFATRSRRF